MSGGSYDYLYTHAPNKCYELIEMISPMAERLSEILPDQKPTRETQAILEALKRLATATEHLAQFWQAIEYFDSGDWTWESVLRYLEDYT